MSLFDDLRAKLKHLMGKATPPESITLDFSVFGTKAAFTNTCTSTEPLLAEPDVNAILGATLNLRKMPPTVTRIRYNSQLFELMLDGLKTGGTLTQAELAQLWMTGIPISIDHSLPLQVLVMDYSDGSQRRFAIRIEPTGRLRLDELGRDRSDPFLLKD